VEVCGSEDGGRGVVCNRAQGVPCTVAEGGGGDGGTEENGWSTEMEVRNMSEADRARGRTDKAFGSTVRDRDGTHTLNGTLGVAETRHPRILDGAYWDASKLGVRCLLRRGEES